MDEVVIDIKMFNGSVDVLQGMRRESCITEKNILRKRVPRLSYSNYRHAKHGGRQVMDGWYSYTAIIFRNIAEGATVKDTFML
jgi:hypothetical protein